MSNVHGKAGVITGAAQGIGRACALRLAENGASVLLADRQGEAAEQLAQDIRAAGGKARAIIADVAIEGDVISTLRCCETEWGKLDFLVQNAAVQVEKPLHETLNEEWDLLHAVNLRALFWGAKHAIAMMIESGQGGSIINMASVLALAADPGLAAYTTMKHGVLGLTRSIATNRTYARHKIRCNCICPGDILTPMQEQFWASLPASESPRRYVESQYPGSEIGKPSDVAAYVAFLASDDAAFINGSAMVIDGGLLPLYY